MFCQGVQGGGFFGVIPHEELADQEALILNAAEADEKCAGARTPGQTGGLGVQESPLAGMHFADGPIGQRVQKVVRQFFQGGDFVAAVPLVAGIEFGGLEVLAARGFDDLPGDEIFHPTGSKRFGFRPDDLLEVTRFTLHAGIRACRGPIYRSA